MALRCSPRNCGDCLGAFRRHSAGMRCFAVIGLVLSASFPAAAEPVSMMSTKQALADAGADGVALAYNDGSPVISGTMDETPFEALLSGCNGTDLTCTRVQLQACFALPGQSRIEALEFVNDWNGGNRLTIAAAQDDWLGQSACLKYVDDLEGISRFGKDEIFLWRIELEDFRQAVADMAPQAVTADRLDSGGP